MKPLVLEAKKRKFEFAVQYPTVVTFYTPTWEYPQYAARMKSMCENLGLLFYAKEYDNTGQWIMNTAIKPHFIQHALTLLKRPILWIDADGSLLKVPEIFKAPYPFDFAARKQHGKTEREWHVGTMYFNYTPDTVAFVNDWVEMVKKFPASDEGALDLLWKQGGGSKLTTSDIPPTYFEMLRHTGQQPRSDTVIAHRASRCPNKLESKKRWAQKKGQNKS